MTGHKHEWKLVMHTDGCHFYASDYSCTCGAARRVWSERDLRDDPWSAVWMADEGGERCERCEELMNGAEPNHSGALVS